MEFVDTQGREGARLEHRGRHPCFSEARRADESLSRFFASLRMTDEARTWLLITGSIEAKRLCAWVGQTQVCPTCRGEARSWNLHRRRWPRAHPAHGSGTVVTSYIQSRGRDWAQLEKWCGSACHSDTRSAEESEERFFASLGKTGPGQTAAMGEGGRRPLRRVRPGSGAVCDRVCPSRGPLSPAQSL